MEEQPAVNSQNQQAPVNPKSNYWIIGGIILILLLIFGVIFTLSLPSRKHISPPPKPLASSSPISTTPDETANWKTYVNTKVGFQIKYPPRYPKPMLPSGLESIVYADGTEDNADIIFGETSDDFISLIVFPFSGTLDQLVDARKDNKTPVWLSGTPTILKREFQVNGIKVRWYTSMPPTVYPGDTVGRIETYFIGIDHGFILYSNLGHDEKEIDQILSTFKFLDQEQTDSLTTPQPVKLAREDLAKQLDTEAYNIEIIKIEERTWSNSSLGCPKEGFFYAEVITPGYRVTFQYKKTLYFYNTDKNLSFIPCDKNS